MTWHREGFKIQWLQIPVKLLRPTCSFLPSAGFFVPSSATAPLLFCMQARTKTIEHHYRFHLLFQDIMIALQAAVCEKVGWLIQMAVHGHYWKSWSQVLSLKPCGFQEKQDSTYSSSVRMQVPGDGLKLPLPSDTCRYRQPQTSSPNICILTHFPAEAEWRFKGLFFSRDQHYFP